MLVPKKTKFRKVRKGRIKGIARSGYSLDFGAYGLKTLEPERLTARQIESARRTIMRFLRRNGKLWIRIFPDVPVTKKPAEVRMGGGKGAPEYFVAKVKPGKVLFELDGITEEQARGAFKLAAAKLPVLTKFVMHTVARQ